MEIDYKTNRDWFSHLDEEKIKTPVETIISSFNFHSKRLNKKDFLCFLTDIMLKAEKKFAFYYFKEGIKNPVMFSPYETEDDFERVWQKANADLSNIKVK